MKRKLPTFGVIAVILSLATLILFISVMYKKTETSTIPTIRINLSNTSLDNVISNSKDVKYQNNTIIITDSNSNTTYENIELKGRGNSTWGWPKPPLQIKFKSNVNLLGMESSRTWILLSNYLDKSNLRNAIAFHLEEMLEQQYAYQGQFVELYVDDKYLGLYYLTEKPEIDKNRIDLRDDLGILAELDNLHSTGKLCDKITEQQSCLIIKDLRNKDKSEKAFDSFVDEFDQLEKAAIKGDYPVIQSIIDVDSFAKYFILSEFTTNPDAYSSSFYFYKDGLEDQIHAAPGWDFDLSLGNLIWIWPRTQNFYSPETTRITEKYAFGETVYDDSIGSFVNLEPDKTISRLLYHLYNIPEFKSRVKYIYRHQIMGHKEELLNYIRNQANYIHTAAIQDRTLWREKEFELLEKLGENDETKIKNIIHSNMTIEEVVNYEIDYIIDWVTRRLDHFDQEYSGFEMLPKTGRV